MRFTISAPVLKAALLSVLAVAQVNAFFRMPCSHRTGLARIDPLVTNGSAAAHVHAIHGSGGFGVSAGYDALMSSSCSSCDVSQDKSAYWHPALYFQDDDDGQYTMVEQVGGMLVYYLLHPNAGNTTITAFPPGFEMIAGDTKKRDFPYPVPDIEKSLWFGEYAEQPFLRQAAIGYNCLNYRQKPEGSLYRHFLPDKAYLDAHCADGVRFELMFPSCWNGKDVTSSDKKSHVAYPSQVMTGECPPDFPERLPSLFFETIWATNAFKGKKGRFISSDGDHTGYGYHGDFMTGWNQEFLQEVVNTCTNLSGMIEDCPLFNRQDNSMSANCKFGLPNELKNEEVVSGLSALPGKPMMAHGQGYVVDSEAGAPAPPPNGGTTDAPAAHPILSYVPGQGLALTDTNGPGGISAAQASSAVGPGYAIANNAAVPEIPSSTTSPTTAQPSTLQTTPIPTAIPDQNGEPRTYTGEDGIVTIEHLVLVEYIVTVSHDSPAYEAPAVLKRAGGGAHHPVAVKNRLEVEKKRHVHAHHRGGHL